MKRINAFNTYDANPKTIIGQNTLYNNMSHHYRRLYNAKPCVDTSMPKSYKLLKQRERFIGGCKNGLKVRGQSVQKKALVSNNTNLTSGKKLNYHFCGVEEIRQKDILDDIKSAPFQPRILKTSAESKIRTLREYHPPRKKIATRNVVGNQITSQCKNTSTPLNGSAVNQSDDQNYVDYEDDCDWLQPSQQQDGRSVSKPSSSDSAYTEEGEGMWSGGESRNGSPQQLYPPNWSSRIWSDDHLYIKFLRAITDDVLRKGIYTNKALKSLFQEHINKNKHKLDMKRMQAEVDKLQQDLEIPIDDNLNDVDYGLGGGIDVTHNFVQFNDCVEIIDSLDELSLNPVPSKAEEWLSNQTSWSNKHDSIDDELKLPLKLPNSDVDNDSSIGCEILTSSTNKRSVESPSNVEDR